MKKYFLFFLLMFFVCSITGQNHSTKLPQIEYADTLFGVVIPDPYHWMEDIHSKEVLKFVRAENKNTRKSIKKTKQLHKDFFKEVEQRQIISRPGRELFDRPAGDYIYYTRYKGLSTQHYRKKRDGSGEELLLDEKEAVAGKKGFDFMLYKLSPNQQQIAYVIANDASNNTQLRIKYHIHSKTHDEEIFNAISYEWMNDSTIIYAPYDKQLDGSDKVYVHRLGTSKNEDQLIYEEQDKTFIVSVNCSKSRKYMFIETSNAYTSETHSLEITTGNLSIIQPRKEGHKYMVSHDAGDTVFFIQTNLNAPNFKIVTANTKNPESKNWADFLPASDYFIESVESAGNHLVVSEYGDGSMKLSLMEKISGNKSTIDIDETTYRASIVYIDTLKKTIRFTYCSNITPDTYYDYDIASKQLTKIFETQVKNYRKDDYQVEYKTILSGDGYPVPVTIIYSKHTALDGTAPAQMDISASYGIMMLPRFYSDLSQFALLDRGFIYVRADVRGGGGLSSARHRDGTVFHRMNMVYDMFAIAQFLINEKYTSTGKIHLTGRSENGIALGMAANMYPKFWGSLTFIVPKLDVMFDPDPREWLENGNPNIKEEFEYMLCYSPYQNVKKQTYPPMQFIIGLNDKNVPPYEIFKMVAKLNANQIGQTPIYLSTDFQGDHYRFNHRKLMVSPYIFKLAIHNNLLP